MTGGPDPFAALVRELNRRRVRFVVIGVWGANYYARDAGSVFHTEDRDLFLPTEPKNALRAWQAAAAARLELWANDEPLDRPRDLRLARAVVARKALVRATHPSGLAVDFTLVMGGFRFGPVYARRRSFTVPGGRVSAARLEDIVESKSVAGRPKDRLFLAAHEEELMRMLAKRRK